MKQVFMFALLAAFVAIASSSPFASLRSSGTSDVSKCSTTPSKWFGQYRQIGWDNKKPTELVFRIANASYDRDAGKMKSMDIDVGFNGPKTVTLVDYKAKMQYEVVDGKCTKTSVTDSQPTFGVPSSAKYETSEYLGVARAKNLGVLVNEYYDVEYRQGIYLSSYAPVTGDTCVPVLISELTVKPDLTMELYYFANVTTTLPDDPFSIPPECR